ncbi:excinuclease ABC subunit UvrB [bacterium]|nr:excinuclease ABC subunit UvrB [bacterium]
MSKKFKIHSEYAPTGDQPEAIDALVRGILEGRKYQVLLGVTGSGKTFTIANVIEQVQKPTLIISHNKTLAAQLFGEFKQFFPENAVEFFISYYDYYQPEAYIPESDTYIEKDADINEDIDRLRLRATSSILSRRDVIVVASVSCIYGLGSPKDFREMCVHIGVGEGPSRELLLRELVNIHYVRNPVDFYRGAFRARGDVVEIFPAYEEFVVRVEYWGDVPERISLIHPITGEVFDDVKDFWVYPARHFVVGRQTLRDAIKSIKEELAERLQELRSKGKLLEAQRLEQRTKFDIELMMEIGYCPGIENYSRHISGRKPGERPSCLLDYFPDDFLVVIDESHVTVPQLKGMYRGDRSRKETLIEYGFRLPSALDNRPLVYEEFESLCPQTIYVSATPGDFELELTGGEVVEQLIRPTGLVDPRIEVRSTKGQVENLWVEIKARIDKGERVLVTTLTKRMAEDLADYFSSLGAKSRYLHSEINAIERVEILRDLRLGNIEVLVGVNLLREGLDLPEVSLVAIMDADKRGFLRSHRSLIQIAGRAARHSAGTVILYADEITDAMRRAIEETDRRRKIQEEYNKKHNIVPKSIRKSVDSIILTTAVADARESEKESTESKIPKYIDELPIEAKIDELIRLMKKSAKELDFEYAAYLRDQIKQFQEELNIPELRIGKKKRRAPFRKRKKLGKYF